MTKIRMCICNSFIQIILYCLSIILERIWKFLGEEDWCHFLGIILFLTMEKFLNGLESENSEKIYLRQYEELNPNIFIQNPKIIHILLQIIIAINFVMLKHVLIFYNNSFIFLTKNKKYH